VIDGSQKGKVSVGRVSGGGKWLGWWDLGLERSGEASSRWWTRKTEGRDGAGVKSFLKRIDLKWNRVKKTVEKVNDVLGFID
jgi:hypothetical protein